MSGRINLVEAGVDCSKHEHFILQFENGWELRMHDTRKFGRAYLVDNCERVLGDLGVDPLSEGFRLQIFRESLLARRRMLKPLILDQHFLAGMGNIYTDEALWCARLHPKRQSCDLSDNEIERLWRAIPKVLHWAIENRGTSLGDGRGNYSSLSGRRGDHRDSLKVYGRVGEECARCGGMIERIVVAQRSTYLCPKCQMETGS